VFCFNCFFKSLKALLLLFSLSKNFIIPSLDKRFLNKALEITKSQEISSEPSGIARPSPAPPNEK